MDTHRPIRRALLSVSDKTGIVEFARALEAQGVEILSTGGTCKLLADNAIKVTEVSDHTGHPERRALFRHWLLRYWCFHDASS